MKIDNLEEIISVYYDVQHDFELGDRVQFKYTDKHSKHNGIQVVYEKQPGVCYVPFVKEGYPIILNIG